jgi:predicted O-methyltransferase YrrM
MNNFLEYHSWFDETFETKLRGRYFTFRIALNLLLQQPNRNIVETGCIRFLNDFGGGNSTMIFASFVNLYGGHLTTIDISPENMDICKSVTANFAKNIDYIVDNSLSALAKLDKPIDLLYLDSLDVPEVGDATEGQEHNLKEFKIAEHLLHTGSLLLIDDNNMDNGGKSRLTKDYVVSKGWKLILNFDQSLWIK